MKRGLIEWDRQELPPDVLAGRQARCRNLMAARGLDGLLVYTDVWRSGQVRYLTNFIPYWNQGVLLFPREGEPVLAAGLSARVYPWIRETSTVTTIVSGPSLGQEVATQVKKLSWRHVGVGERDTMPHGILNALAEGLPDCELVDATDVLDGLRSEVDDAGLALYRKATEIATQGFAEVSADLPGKTGWQAASLLERALRRRAATDTVILLAPHAQDWPAYPGDKTMTSGGVALVAVEYKGHWVEIGRPLANGNPAVRAEYARAVEMLRPAASLQSLRNEIGRGGSLRDPTLIVSATHRSFPFTQLDSLAGLPRGTVIALHLSGTDQKGARWWWGDPLLVEEGRARPLLPERER